MKKEIILLFIFFSFSNLYSQDYLGSTSNNMEPFVCSFKCDNSFESLKSNCLGFFRDTPIPEDYVNPYEEFKLVISTLRRDRNNPFPLAFLFKECDYVCNAASVVVDDVNHIYYNQDFLNQIKTPSGEMKWAVRSIIAHEIGHHILGHTYPTGNSVEPPERRRRELRADYFSAFVIQQFPGSTLENALAGLNSLDPINYRPRNEEEEEYNNYPTLANRMLAIKQGFTDSNKSKLRIALFKSIDSIVSISNERWGKSVIFQEIDEYLSYGNIIEAKGKVEELSNKIFSDIEKTRIQEIKTFLDEKYKLNKIFEFEKNTSSLNQGELNILKDLYDNHKDLDTEQSEVLLKAIHKLEEVKIKGN